MESLVLPQEEDNAVTAAPAEAAEPVLPPPLPAYNKPRNSMARAKKEVDDQIYEMQVRICKAFANSTRIRMLDLLAKREYTVSGLEQALQVSKTNISQHLAILKAAGVVATRREGKQIYCALAIPQVKTACQLIRDVLRAQLRNGRRLSI